MVALVETINFRCLFSLMYTPRFLVSSLWNLKLVKEMACMCHSQVMIIIYMVKIILIGSDKIHLTSTNCRKGAWSAENATDQGDGVQSSADDLPFHQMFGVTKSL